jgi:hypothetical protein
MKTMPTRQIIFSFILMIFAVFSYSQTPKPLVSIPAFNYIFRGVSTEVELGNISQLSNLKIVCQDLKLDTLIQQVENVEDLHVRYFLTAMSASKGYLIFIDSLNMDTLEVKEFKIINIPPPEITLKGMFNSNQITLTDLVLLDEIELGYKYFFPLDLEFEIVNWEITFLVEGNQKSFRGKGSKLTSEVKRGLQFLSEGNKISIVLKNKGNGFEWEGFSAISILLTEKIE